MIVASDKKGSLTTPVELIIFAKSRPDVDYNLCFFLLTQYHTHRLQLRYVFPRQSVYAKTPAIFFGATFLKLSGKETFLANGQFLPSGFEWHFLPLFFGIFYKCGTAHSGVAVNKSKLGNKICN